MRLSQSELAKLKAELVNDPRGYGYGTDLHSIRDELNRTRAGLTIQDDSVRAAKLREGVDRGEFLALTAGEQRLVLLLLSEGNTLNVGVGSNLRTVLAGLFGNGSATRTSWMLLLIRDGSRAEELLRPNIFVTWQDVVKAMRMP